MPLLAGLKREQFQVVLLDQKNKIIKDVMVSQGSLTASVVHPPVWSIRAKYLTWRFVTQRRRLSVCTITPVVRQEAHK